MDLEDSKQKLQFIIKAEYENYIFGLNSANLEYCEYDHRNGRNESIEEAVNLIHCIESLRIYSHNEEHNRQVIKELEAEVFQILTRADTEAIKTFNHILMLSEEGNPFKTKEERVDFDLDRDLETAIRNEYPLEDEIKKLDLEEDLPSQMMNEGEFSNKIEMLKKVDYDSFNFAIKKVFLDNKKFLIFKTNDTETVKRVINFVANINFIKEYLKTDFQDIIDEMTKIEKIVIQELMDADQNIRRAFEYIIRMAESDNRGIEDVYKKFPFEEVLIKMTGKNMWVIDSNNLKNIFWKDFLHELKS